MKTYFSIIATLVLVATAQASECPRGKTSWTEPDGTRVIRYETGLVTTISPRYQIDHYFDPISEEQRINTLTYCNLGTPTSRVRTPRPAIVTPTGQVTGYITTK